VARITARAGRGLLPDLEPNKEKTMGLLLAVLLLIVLLAVLGFAVTKFLLWIAAIVLVVWLVGFFVRGVEGARWYRW
jgi:type II secretory pathway component PulF